MSYSDISFSCFGYGTPAGSLRSRERVLCPRKVLALNVFVGYLVVRCGIWAFDDAAEGALIFMLSVALYALFIPVSICIAYLLLNIDID